MTLTIEELKKIIVSQREEIEEIFEKEKIIERKIDKNYLCRYLKYPNILAILGIRRSGKSILSHLLLKGKKYGYINFDDERLTELNSKNLESVLQSFYELYGTDLEYIILDEIQNIPNWELFVNRLRRTKKVIITGSNSKLLSSELSTHLTGRYMDFTLFPFNFWEFLIYNNYAFKEKDFYSTKKISEVKRFLQKYLLLGGFPEVYKFGGRYLIKIYEDIVNKDIFGRYNIKYKKTFREITNYLISNFADEVTYSKLKNIFRIKDVHTIKNYMDFLSSSYLLIVLERFSYKLKNQIIAPKKVYCIDTGIINKVGFKSIDKTGKLMENLVLIELLIRKYYRHNDLEIYYWKDYQQREVEFVLKKRTKAEQLIQVCYSLEDYNTKKREIKSLLKAGKELKCKNLLIISWDEETEIKENNLVIKIYPLWKWLLS